MARRPTSWTFLLAAALVLTAAGHATDAVRQAAGPLGVGDAAARALLIDAMSGGGELHDYVKVVDAIWKAYDRTPVAARGALTTAAFAWAKAWMSTPAFKAEYARIREEHRPPGAQAGGSLDDEIKKLRDEMLAVFQESRKVAATLPPADRDKFLANLKYQEDMLEDPAWEKQMRASIQAQRGEADARESDAVARWNDAYPAEPNAFIRKWLDRFMEQTADLDFDLPAIVIRNTRGEMLGFLSPGYLTLGWEKEHALSAGREAVAAARAAVAAWLKELQGT